MEAWSRFSFTGLDEVELLADELLRLGACIDRQLRATLARRRASRSRFTWLCLYEVELLGELEAERLRDVWGSLSSGCGCHLTPAPLKNFHYIKEISRLVGGLALI